MKKLTAVFCIVLSMISALAPGASAARPDSANAAEWEVLKITNQERKAEGLKPLSTFSKLQSATKTRAKELVTKFDHTRPNGSSCFTALKELNIDYGSAAENIAAGQRDAAAVMNTWMNSPGHRANILIGRFKHLGVGYYYNGSSLYGAHWAQLFVGGCTTTGIGLTGDRPLFDAAGNLVSTDDTLTITCNLHGTSYLPLESAEYTCQSHALGNGTMKVTYDGVTVTLPCAVGFSDVQQDAWYMPGVEYAANEGLMSGYGNGKFDPNGKMTRAMAAQVLYQMSGAPKVSGIKNPFKDVPNNAWYTNAVLWAADKGITAGTGAATFSPDMTITRGQLAGLLKNYAQLYNKKVSKRASLDGFVDVKDTPDWAKEALRWAVAEDLINGALNGEKLYLLPNGAATRAQVATVLKNFAENVMK